MNKLVYTFVIFFIMITIFSCSKEKRSLKLLKVTEYSSSKVSDSSLLKILKIKDDLDVFIDYTLSADYALKQLSDKKTDLVIIPNSARSEDMTIKAIIPLLPRVLMIMTNKNVKDRSLKDILENGTVYFEDRSKLDSVFFDKLFYSFNIDESKIDSKLGSTELKIDEKSDSLKVYVGLMHLNNYEVKDLIQHDWLFFSLDDIDNYGKGSKIEGFALMNMSIKPFIIPRSIFKGKPDNSVLTVSINDILITRSEIHNDIIYGITKTLYNNRSRLIQMNSVYNLLDFNYDRQDLSFPLHKGALQFLDRNEPPVWSKYVKMIWPLISISVVLFGILTSFRNRFKRRKKQNIEMYYNSLLEIRSKSEEATDKGTLIDTLKELKVLRSQAMKSLADKKLDPGESFNIFLALYNDTKTDLIENLKEIRLKTQESKT